MALRGHPTLYSPQMLAKAYRYVEKCQDEIYIFQKQSGKIDGFEEKIKTHLPTVVGLALFLGVNKDSLYEWAKHYPVFSDTLLRIKQLQEQALLDGGLSNRYNPLITKLILSTNHGYKENQAVAISIPVPIYGGRSKENEISGHDSNQEDIPTPQKN